MNTQSMRLFGSEMECFLYIKNQVEQYILIDELRRSIIALNNVSAEKDYESHLKRIGDLLTTNGKYITDIIIDKCEELSGDVAKLIDTSHFKVKGWAEEQQQPAEPQPLPVEHATVKKHAGKQSIPIDIYKDGVLVHHCASKTDAKSYLHWSWGTIEEAIDKGPLRNGMELRTHTALDDCLQEIDKNNKQPYQFSR